jgi:hypothetical protein
LSGTGGRLAGKHGRELITLGKSGRGKILGDRLNLLRYTVVLQAQSIIWFIAHFLSYAGNYRVSATGSKLLFTQPQLFSDPNFSLSRVFSKKKHSWHTAFHVFITSNN